MRSNSSSLKPLEDGSSCSVSSIMIGHMYRGWKIQLGTAEVRVHIPGVSDRVPKLSVSCLRHCSITPCSSRL